MNKLQIILLTSVVVLTFTASVLFVSNYKQNEVEQYQSFIYNSQLAENLSGFSLVSYCRPSKIIDWNCGAACKKNPEGLQDVFVMRNKTMDSGGYLGYSPTHDAILVVFRGTVPWLIKNWITDINTVKTDYPHCLQGCKVHRGFYNAFIELQEQIMTEFPKLKSKYPNAKIFVTGHSLGAALGTHAIPIIYQLNGNKPIDAFYNFGSPRVGDDNFRNWFDNQRFVVEYGRVIHNADPVPHLPPSWFPFKFSHLNQEIFYKSFNQPFIQCDEIGTHQCSESLKIATNVLDHISYFGWNWSFDILACQ